MRKGFEWFAFERGKNQDSDLIAGFQLVGFKVMDKRGSDMSRQHLREVHDTACERRYFKCE